jgi:hypothetical protein
MSEAAEARAEDERLLRISRTRLAAAAAAALAAGLLAWVAAGGYEDLSFTERERAAGADIPSAMPVGVSLAQLRSVAGSLGYPMYWKGPAKPGFTYELTRLVDGRIFLRYLSPGAPVGDLRPDHAFVGTYPDANAFARIRKAARKRGEIVRKTPGGGLVVGNERGPELVRATTQPLPTPPVFFSRPGSDVLVEVYDPVEMRRALRVATSGRLRPVR